jgi:hypothetical protein
MNHRGHRVHREYFSAEYRFKRLLCVLRALCGENHSVLSVVKL